MVLRTKYSNAILLLHLFGDAHLVASYPSENYGISFPFRLTNKQEIELSHRFSPKFIIVTHDSRRGCSGTHASSAWNMYGTAADSYPMWRIAALQYTLGVGTELEARLIFDILVVTCMGDCACKHMHTCKPSVAA